MTSGRCASSPFSNSTTLAVLSGNDSSFRPSMLKVITCSEVDGTSLWQRSQKCWLYSSLEVE